MFSLGDLQPEWQTHVQLIVLQKFQISEIRKISSTNHGWGFLMGVTQYRWLGQNLPKFHYSKSNY